MKLIIGFLFAGLLTLMASCPCDSCFPGDGGSSRPPEPQSLPPEPEPEEEDDGYSPPGG